MKFSLLIACLIIFVSCTSDKPVNNDPNSGALKVKLGEDKPKPNVEKEDLPSVEEQNAAFRKGAEGLDKHINQLQAEQDSKDKLAFERTKPLVVVTKRTVDAYQKEARAGDANTQYKLGMLYKYGLGVEEDKNKALFWFKKAADQGHMKARRVYLFMNRR